MEKNYAIGLVVAILIVTAVIAGAFIARSMVTYHGTLAVTVSMEVYSVEKTSTPPKAFGIDIGFNGRTLETMIFNQFNNWEPVTHNYDIPLDNGECKDGTVTATLQVTGEVQVNHVLICNGGEDSATFAFTA